MSSIVLFADMAFPDRGGNGGAAALGIMCFGFLIAIPIGLSIAALMLRLACQMAAVPPPSFPMAMGVELVSGIAVVGVMVVLVALDGTAGAMMGPGSIDQMESHRFANSDGPNIIGLIVLPFMFVGAVLVHAGVYSAMLNISFGKGLLVWLCRALIHFIVSFCLGVVLVALVVVLGVVASNAHH